MAFGSLFTALKVVPWSDVITAAPGLVKGARKLFAGEEAAATTPVVPPDADAMQRLALLESRVADMSAREQASIKLIEGLAEQNAAVVEALRVMRARARWSLVLNVVLAVIAAGALALSYGRFGGG